MPQVFNQFTTKSVGDVLRLEPGAKCGWLVAGDWNGDLHVERLNEEGSALLEAPRSLDGIELDVDTQAGSQMLPFQNVTNEAILVRVRAQQAHDVPPSGTFTGSALAALFGQPLPTLSSGYGFAQDQRAMVTEQGNAVVHVTRVNLCGLAITLVNAQQGGGRRIYTFPDGYIQVLGAVARVTIVNLSDPTTTLNASVTCNFGLGTITQANAQLAGLEQNIVPKTNVTAPATRYSGGNSSPAALAAPLLLDGNSSPADVFVNVAVAADADLDANADIILIGDVILTWIALGKI